LWLRGRMPNTLEGIIEWEGGALDLNGTLSFFNPTGHPLADGTYNLGQPVSFDMVGTGRPGTETDGWEYRYHGHLTRTWANSVDQRPTLVGSVIRQKAHNGRPGRWAGEVFSFIATRPEARGAPEMALTGRWHYRSFHNEPQYPYLKTYPTAQSLILEESVLQFETPSSTTLKGTIKSPSQGLDERILVLDIDPQKGIVRPAKGGEPTSFTFSAIGRRGTETDGWECGYDGYLTRNWPSPAGAPANVPRLPALGTVIREKAQGDSPAGAVCPFIAVWKQ